MKSNLMLVIILALFLSIILTWPLLPNITSYYTDQGDYSLVGSNLWYNQDSLKTGRIFSPKDYWHGFQFYPQPYSLAFANNSVSPTFIFAPIYWISGNLPLSVNSYALATLVLSFITSFYMIRYFLGDKGEKGNKGDRVIFLASIVGAFIYTFNPQTMGRFPQHLDILGKYFLPLVFLFAYKLLEKPTLKKGLLFFLFFTLNSLTAAYYQIFSLIMLPIVALPFLIGHLRKGDWGYLGRLGRSGLVGLIFLPILLYFNLPYLQFSQQEGAYRPLEATPFFSARINDWFVPSPDNMFYSGWVKSMEPLREPKDDRNILNYEEHTLFTGILPLILFILGFKYFLKQKNGRIYFLLLLILPFILTFGPFAGYKEDGFRLPFYYLYKFVPALEGIRSPTRFEFLFFIPFALIASFGVKWILEKKAGKRGVWVIGIIGVILILENLTIKNFDIRSQSLKLVADTGIENLNFLKNSAVLHFPIYSTEDADVFGKNSAYTNWATQTGEKIVNGNTSYLPPDQLGLLASFQQGFNEKGIGILSALGVDYIIVHKNLLQTGDQAIFSKMEQGLLKGAVLNTSELLIVKLSSYNQSVSVCTIKDMDIRSSKIADDNFTPVLALIINNKKDCYLISTFDNRYQQKTINIDGSMKKVHFRLPIVIAPQDQIILSESDRTLRVE